MTKARCRHNAPWYRDCWLCAQDAYGAMRQDLFLEAYKAERRAELYRRRIEQLDQVMNDVYRRGDIR